MRCFDGKSFHLMSLAACGLLLLTGCGPSPRETALGLENEQLKADVVKLTESVTAKQKAGEELRARVADLEGRLATAEKETSELRVAAANTPERGKEDLQYTLEKKEAVPEQTIEVDAPGGLGVFKDTKHMPAQWRLYFKGVQTGRAYPPLTVTEVVFSRYTEGTAYTRADLNKIKSKL